MENLILKNSCRLSFIPIPEAFIERFVPKANPVFITLYLYAFRKCMLAEPLSLKAMADAFDILESDVIKAWKYWSKQGVVNFKMEEEEISIEFLPVENKALDIKNEEPNKEKKSLSPSKPNYSPQELEICLKQSKEGKHLLSVAEKILGRMLTYTDMSTIYSFYDWLGMDIDLIELLMIHCVKNGGHRKMRYIETVAIEWAEKGIDTVEKANEYIKKFDVDYREIMRAFGLNLTPIKEQQAFMDKWLNTYKMPLDVIKEACKKTIMQIGKPEFKYADKIISTWYEKNIKSLDAVKKQTEEFNLLKEINKTSSKPVQPQKAYPKPNKFINFEQREYDFEQLNKMKRNLLDSDL